MTSDPYAAGYTFARSAFTGGPTQDQKAVRMLYIYIYIYIYTDSEIIVLTRWGSLIAKARPNYTADMVQPKITTCTLGLATVVITLGNLASFPSYSCLVYMML